MSRIILFLPFFLASVHNCGFECLGQSLFERAADDEVEFILTPKNQFARLLSSKRKRLAGAKDIAFFLANSKVEEELGLSAQQSKEVKKLIQQAANLRAKVNKDSKNNPYTAKTTHRESIPKYLKLEKQIHEALLEHQQKRLQQLIHRWIARNTSLPVFLANEFRKAEMTLTSNQILQLKQLCDSVEKKVASSLKSARTKYVSSFRENLTDKQKEELALKIPEQFQADFVCISLAAMRLDNLNQSKKEKKTEYWHQISQQNSYRLKPDGSLEIHPREELDSLTALNYLWMNFSSPFFADLLLTNEQVSQLRKDYLSYNKALGDFYKNLPIEFKKNQAEHYAEFKKQSLDLHRAETTKVLKQFRESLTKPQLAAMKTLFGQVQCSNLGLVQWVLSENGLKDELRVSDSQKRKVVDALKKLVDKFRRESTQLESEFERDIQSILDSAQRQQMKKLMGRPIKNSDGSPELFLQRLRLTSSWLKRQ